MSGGLEHALFVSDSGQAFGCGFNGQGQLGIPMGFNQSTHMLKIPQLIDSVQSHTIVSVSAGFAHSLFLNEKGEVFSVGCNQKYQLGL
jgi:alpha-tubulin suppressor-like RCC1 family protein